MGKALNGKELGVGISQRQDGLYQARFTNINGKRITIYDKSLKNIRDKLRRMDYEVNDSNITLNQWFDIWIKTCKCNCRGSTIRVYTNRYKSISKHLGKYQ